MVQVYQVWVCGELGRSRVPWSRTTRGRREVRPAYLVLATKPCNGDANWRRETLVNSSSIARPAGSKKCGHTARSPSRPVNSGNAITHDLAV